MKKRVISTICAILLVLNLSGAAMAVEPRASYYFGYTDVYASWTEDGEVLVEVEVEATHTMTQVGVKRLYIYEQQSDGDYDIVYTFSCEDDSNMMATNTPFYDGAFTYQGTPGVKYYATASLYAKDSSGSETMYVNSNIV